MVDFLSLGFILAILVVSGGIAFVADGLGKKIGKKRLSLFGLRPKHVASLGTVAMGVFVSGLTIGFIAAVSRDAREWLKEGRGLLLQRDALKENVELQKSQLKGLNEQLGDERTKIREVQGKLDAKFSEAKVLDLRVKGLDADLHSKNDALREAKVELGARQRAIDSLQVQLPKLKSRVTVAQELVRSTNVVLTTIRKNLAVAQGDLKTALHNKQVAVYNQNEALKTSIKTYNEKLALQKGLDEEVQTRKDLVASLKAEEAGLVAERDEAQAQAEAAKSRYADIHTQLEGADQELAQMQEKLQTQASFLNSGFKTSRTEAMTFRRGEEVARVVVPAGADVETAQNALASLLRSARIEATGRGAKGHRAGGKSFEAAEIMDRKDPKTGDVTDADTLRRAFAASLTNRKDDQVLVATSSLNAFSGEPVSLDLAALPNPVVYRRNDPVAETRINGGQREDQILAQLSQFVNGDLQHHVAQARMIPRAGTSAPFGEPSAADVWKLLQSVRKAGRSVRVQAYAGDDIRAADPLHVEFRVN